MTHNHLSAALAITAVLLVDTAAQTPSSNAPASTFELLAEWGPVESSTYRFVERHETVAEAMGAGPATPRAEHPVDSLRPLLPPPDATAGDIWEIDVATVLPFLAQLHPSVTARLRHAHPSPEMIERFGVEKARKMTITPAVEGGKAILLASDAACTSILMRVHVEFELIPNELWFLPAQYEGLLEWDHESDRARSFHLALPARDTNWDMNYRGGGADIGYLPLMQVATAGASPAGDDAEPARQRLREAFYPASKINWRPLAVAFARAKKNGRRLHVMQLFGTLDDESC